MTTNTPAPPSLDDRSRSGQKGWQIRRAVADLRDGALCYPLWGTIGFHEIRQRYRRSTLGPLWITLSMAIMVFALGVLYGRIFGQDLSTYLPFLAAGFVVWGLIAQLLLDGSQAFIASQGMLRQLATPLSLYVYRIAWSNLLIFIHNIWVFLAVALWYQVPVGWSTLLVVPGLLVLLANGIWVGLLAGLLSARFRDVPLILASIVQVMFFITPVIWQPEMLPGRALLLDLNPFFHMVEIVRAPLLGSVPAWENWLSVLLITLTGWAIALAMYSVYRWRIPYWV